MLPGLDRAAGLIRQAPAFSLLLSTTVIAAGGGGGGPGGGEPAGTPLDDMVMYAVDDNTHQLIRHRFGTDEDPEIGILRYADGHVADDVECLGFIPSGPTRGLYGVDNYGGSTYSRLVKINVLQGTLEPPGGNTGYGNIEGMVGAWDPGADQWVLYATQSGGTGGGASLQMNWSANGQSAQTLYPDGTYNETFGWWTYSGSQPGPLGLTLNYSLNASPDGMISGNVSINNSTDEPIEVEVVLHHPLSASRSGGSGLAGSAAIGLTTDDDGGTVSAVTGDTMWQAMLDGAPVGGPGSIFSDPYQLHNDGFGSIGDNTNFGIPTRIDGPPAMQSIGVRIGFSLTAHDQMSMTSVFLVEGETDPASTKNILRINPETGVASLVMTVNQSFEGLALGDNGMLYASRQQQLWGIDLNSGGMIHLGSHGFSQVEALDFAMGSQGPAIDIPGVPSWWTSHGALLGFSDSANALLVINPSTGQAMAYDWEINVNDLEGMVFMPIFDDPFGDIIAVVGD